MKLSISARAFVTLVIVLGLCVLAYAAVNANVVQIGHVAVFVVIACVAARLKVKLPSVTGSMSVNLPFILLAVAEMSLAEALIVGCISNLTQCLPARGKKFNAVQAAFNVCTMALAIGATRLFYSSPGIALRLTSHPLHLAMAAAMFFLVNTIAVAVVLTLTESNSLGRTWLEMCQLSFPYYLASAGVAGVALTLASRSDWQLAVAILPLMLAVFYSYRRYFSGLSQAVAEALRRPVQSQPAMAAGASAKAGA
ncbi:MAG TPA: hypothetical protein VKW06_03130 [Candidatus Angelobacter sp.]|nr:hypothetical protein [Candidatus Angelobacter sp.]